jgi:DNA transposition AAA+ family ATPase
VRDDSDEKIYALANRTRAVFYTPRVATTQKTLEQELSHITVRAERCIEEHLASRGQAFDHTGRTPWAHFIELVIIDEAERLSANVLEFLRDQYDRTNRALILIGMPGIDKTFSHYPQLYSRLGFAHQYRPLGHDELQFVLERHWRKLGKTLDLDDFTDAQAFAAVERITRGNFRLLERLFPQIERVLKINDLDVITNDVVEAARSTLVIGAT